jgi:2-phospho-L-lactate guanylyltransferase
VQYTDIDELLAIECSAPAVVIVPSRDGTGTNAILRAHPCLFPSHFGPGSFAKHLAEAEQASAQIIIRRNPRLELDVDDKSDLRALLEHDLRGTQTGSFLQESGIAARFASFSQEVGASAPT